MVPHIQGAYLGLRGDIPGLTLKNDLTERASGRYYPVFSGTKHGHGSPRMPIDNPDKEWHQCIELLN